MAEKMQLTLEGFLQLYDSLGLSIVPVNSQKIPMTEWLKYQKERASLAQLEEWFVRPRYRPNLAVCCGAVSQNLIGLDFENEKSYLEFFTEEGAKKLEAETIVVGTSHGGTHVWLKELGEVPRRNVRICVAPNEVDLLGEGGLMMVPPSIINHLLCDKKKRYRCPKDGSASYACTTTYTVRGTSFKILERMDILNSLTSRAEQLGWKLRDYTQYDPTNIAREGVKSGERNNEAFKYTRYLLFGVKLHPDVAWLEMQRVNKIFRPPLVERELRTCFESAEKYQPEQDTEEKKQAGVFEI